MFIVYILPVNLKVLGTFVLLENVQYNPSLLGGKLLPF